MQVKVEGIESHKAEPNLKETAVKGFLSPEKPLKATILCFATL